MQTKELPETREEAEKFAANHAERIQREKEEARRKQTKKLEALLEQGENEEAVAAAVSVLQKMRPELLKNNDDKIE